MAREISSVCNFIFSSICTSLPTDTVDVELMIRTVKVFIPIGKTIWLNPWCFHHEVGLCSPFPCYAGKSKPFKVNVDKQQCGIITMPCPTFLPLLSLNITPGSMHQERPGLGGLTKGIDSTL